MVADTARRQLRRRGETSTSALRLVALRRGDRRRRRGSGHLPARRVLRASARRSRWTSSTGSCSTGGRDLDAASYGAEAHPENEPVGPASRPGRARPGAGGARARTCRCSASAAGCRCSTSPSAAASTSTSPTPTQVHRSEPGTFIEPRGRGRRRHPARRDPRTDEATVRSHHHQGVEPLADALRRLGARRPTASSRRPRSTPTRRSASASSGIPRRTSQRAGSGSTTR